MSEHESPISESEPRTRWSEVSGGIGGATAYQRRFDEMAKQGLDVHGEAALAETLISPPARILDAGCGTGRVASQLTSLGYHCVGVDVDADMIAVARKRDPATVWVQQDLSRLQLRTQAFDLAILAGNVVPLLAPGSLVATMERVAAHVQPGGLVVAGFGLDPGHLPAGVPVTPLADYDRACGVAGLSFLRRYSTWDRQAWRPESSYVVSVHRLND